MNNGNQHSHINHGIPHGGTIHPWGTRMVADSEFEHDHLAGPGSPLYRAVQAYGLNVGLNFGETKGRVLVQHLRPIIEGDETQYLNEVPVTKELLLRKGAIQEAPMVPTDMGAKVLDGFYYHCGPTWMGGESALMGVCPGCWRYMEGDYHCPRCQELARIAVAGKGYSMHPGLFAHFVVNSDVPGAKLLADVWGTGSTPVNPNYRGYHEAMSLHDVLIHSTFDDFHSYISIPFIVLNVLMPVIHFLSTGQEFEVRGRAAAVWHLFLKKLASKNMSGIKLRN